MTDFTLTQRRRRRRHHHLGCAQGKTMNVMSFDGLTQLQQSDRSGPGRRRGQRASSSPRARKAPFAGGMDLNLLAVMKEAGG